MLIQFSCHGVTGAVLSLAGAATSTIFTKHPFSQNIFVATKLLTRQIFVATNIFFVYATKLPKYHFCRDKTVVATEVSWQLPPMIRSGLDI